MDAGLRRAAEAAKGFMPPDEGLALHDAAAAAAAAQPGRPLLEVGTYCGKSAIYLGAAARPHGATVFTVDHHHGSEENQAGWEHHDQTLVDPGTGRLDTLPTFRRTIEGAGLEATVVAVIGESTTVAAQWTTPLAFLFIDGGHGHDVAWADYRAWAPKVAPGGTLAIHDVFPDPADGGRPPYELYCDALASGRFEEVAAVGSLRVLRRRRPARQLWEAVEPIHATVYFAPSAAEAMKALGLKGWWMGYFAGRFAPLGAVGPAAATAMAFGFAPSMVARSLPDAWHFASPEDVVRTRIESAAAGLRAALPPGTDVTELAGRLAELVAALPAHGRPLGAAWLAVPPPDDPFARLWLAATGLREHRGDGHVAAATTLGLDGLEMTLTLVATGAITREAIQPNRGWTDADWDAAVQRLQARGILDEQGALTSQGHALRQDLEDTTDELAAAAGDVERIIEFAHPLSRHLVDQAAVPVPNPIGAPRP